MAKRKKGGLTFQQKGMGFLFVACPSLAYVADPQGMGLAYAIAWVTGIGLSIYAWQMLWKVLAGLGNNQGDAGVVYVIEEMRTGLYKIGMTTNLERRMRELGVGKTARLVQQRQVSDARAVERAAHERYKAHRIPQTEYFKLNSPPSI
jgi:predicted GIY-YIG superfamily endonuclease